MPPLPPWWPDPLDQWTRELRQHSAPVRLDRWIDDHPDEIAAYMKGFVRADAPRIKPWVESVYRLSPRRRLTKAERERRKIIDDLPVERQRLICAAGRLLWRAAVASRRASANDTAKALVEEMLDIYAGPRLKIVRLLVLMFVGEPPSMRQMQKYAKANPSPPYGRRR
jgi:hypothetical protein